MVVRHWLDSARRCVCISRLSIYLGLQRQRSAHGIEHQLRYGSDLGHSGRGSVGQRSLFGPGDGHEFAEQVGFQDIHLAD